MQTDNAQNNPVDDVEDVEPVENTENSRSSENETDTATNEGNEVETNVSSPVADNEVEVLFVDPSPHTTYKTAAYEIDIIHSMTLGDILTSTLISVLIIVVFLSRLLGGRR